MIFRFDFRCEKGNEKILLSDFRKKYLLNLIKSIANGEKKHIGVKSMDRLLDNKDFNYLTYYNDLKFLNLTRNDILIIKERFKRDL